MKAKNVEKMTEAPNELSECRICLDKDAASRLLKPCRCSGSAAYVHFKCLARWIQTQDTDYCSVCRVKYSGVKISKTPKGWRAFLWVHRREAVCTVGSTSVGLWFLFYLEALGILIASSSSQTFPTLSFFVLASSFAFVTLTLVLYVALVYETVCNTRKLYEKWAAKNLSIKVEPMEQTGALINNSTAVYIKI